MNIYTISKLNLLQEYEFYMDMEIGITTTSSTRTKLLKIEVPTEIMKIAMEKASPLYNTTSQIIRELTNGNSNKI